MSLIDQRVQIWSERQISLAVQTLSLRFGWGEASNTLAEPQEYQEIEKCVEFLYDLFLKRENTFF